MEELELLFKEEKKEVRSKMAEFAEKLYTEKK